MNNNNMFIRLHAVEWMFSLLGHSITTEERLGTPRGAVAGGHRPVWLSRDRKRAYALWGVKWEGGRLGSNDEFIHTL